MSEASPGMHREAMKAWRNTAFVSLILVALGFLGILGMVVWTFFVAR
jgi:hypothetical protein